MMEFFNALMTSENNGQSKLLILLTVLVGYIGNKYNWLRK